MLSRASWLDNISIRHICSESIDFERESALLYQMTLERGYTRWSLNRDYNFTKNRYGTEILQENKKSRCKERMIHHCFFSYNLEFRQIGNIVNKYLPILFNNHTCSDILGYGINIVSRKACSLSNILSPSFLTSVSSQSTNGNLRCGPPQCSCCLHMSGDLIWWTSNSRPFKIKGFYNCNTKYVIYMVICRICSIQYVGHISRRIRDHFHEHLSNIRNNRSTNLEGVMWFISCAEGGCSAFFTFKPIS